MSDNNDYVDERAGRFFDAMARSKRVHVSVRTPVRQDMPVGFVRSLRVALPALALVTSAQAQTNTPELVLQVNDQPIEQIEPIGAQLQRAIDFVATAADQFPQVMHCARDFYQQRSEYEPHAAVLFLEHEREALQSYAEIVQWAHTYGRDIKLGVAAYCQNPLDWQGVIMHWDDKVERYQNASVPDQAANYVLDRRAQRADTVYGAVQHAALVQSETQTESMVHKVNGFDWVGAAASLAAGAASMFGQKELNETFRDTARQSRRAEGVYNQAERAGKRQGAQRYEQIGRVMEQASRLGKIPAPIYRRPTY